MESSAIAELEPKRKTGRAVPTWDHEVELHSASYSLVAGVDEAGRGAWAGPLVAGAVILPPPIVLATMEEDIAAEIGRLRDSKMLTKCTRERLLEVIQRVALTTGVGVVSPALIDVIGLGPANRLAMARAVRALCVQPDFVLVDAFKLPSMPVPHRPIIKGDATCMSIAAASVLAKVARDHMMEEQAEFYPGYGFAQHKGYGTRMHVEAIQRLGVSSIHRRSYVPIQAMMAGLPWPPVEVIEEQAEFDL
jgi:ribonuclease HII